MARAMGLVTDYHHTIEAILAFTGFTDKAAHLNVGLALYVGAQFVLRTRRASLQALAFVAGCELCNETLDLLFFGDPRWADTLSDILATLAWPTTLFLLSRYRRERWARLASRARPKGAEALPAVTASPAPPLAPLRRAA